MSCYPQVELSRFSEIADVIYVLLPVFADVINVLLPLFEDVNDLLLSGCAKAINELLCVFEDAINVLFSTLAHCAVFVDAILCSTVCLQT